MKTVLLCTMLEIAENTGQQSDQSDKGNGWTEVLVIEGLDLQSTSRSRASVGGERNHLF